MGRPLPDESSGPILSDRTMDDLTAPFTLLLRRAGSRSRFGPGYRAVGLGLLVVFLAGWVVEAGALQDCSHHALPGDGDHPAEHLHVSHAHPDDPGAHGYAGDPRSDPHGEDHGPCTCRTDCTTSTAVRQAVPEGAQPGIPARSATRVSAAAEVRIPDHTLLPYVLPWSTAPPRV